MIKRLNIRMKTVLGAAALLIALSTTAYAQDKLAEGASKVTAQMKEQLNLNDAQFTKVMDVNKVFLEKAKACHASSATEVEKKKKMKGIIDERESKLKSVLTEDQFKRFAARRSENMKELKAYYQDKK